MLHQNSRIGSVTTYYYYNYKLVNTCFRTATQYENCSLELTTYDFTTIELSSVYFFNILAD